MPNRYLFENVDSVLLFAVIGTIWNTIAISKFYMVVKKQDFSKKLSSCLIFPKITLYVACRPRKKVQARVKILKNFANRLSSPNSSK